MTNNAHSPIGLIAGKGRFPLLFAQEAKKNGREIVVIALKEEVDEDLSPYARSVHTISTGKLDAMIRTLKEEGVKEAVMAGRLEHRKLFSDIVPDFRAVKLLMQIEDRRADSILRAVAEELKSESITLLPSITFLPHLLPERGTLSRRRPNKEEEKNIAFGIRMAQGLAAVDLGQTVVVKERSVLSIEAIEGTNECIRRGAALGGKNIVVVKSAKPNQDLRFDMPVVGPTTFQILEECGAAALAIESGRTLILEKEECLRRAERAGLAVVAW